MVATAPHSMQDRCPLGLRKPGCQCVQLSGASGHSVSNAEGCLPGVGRMAWGSCSQFTRSALDTWPQHMRQSHSLLSGMCWKNLFP